jgi:hypothetical protein
MTGLRPLLCRISEAGGFSARIDLEISKSKFAEKKIVPHM